MPTLYLRSNLQDYYIRGTEHGSNKYYTLQVKLSAISYLLDKQLLPALPTSSNKGVEIHSRIVEILRDRNLVYTKGEGEQQGAVAQVDIQDKQIQFEIIFQSKDHEKWGLALSSLDGKAHWLGKVDSPVWKRCFVDIYDPDNYLPHKKRHIARWSVNDIKNGKACAIVPLAGYYKLDFVGPWPPEILELVGAEPHTTGLFADGDLFHYEGGRRLTPKDHVYPGRQYYFVARSDVTIPAELNPRLMRLFYFNGSYTASSKWQAWKISIPRALSANEYELIQDWLRSKYYSLRKLYWRPALLSPPPLYYDEHIPVFARGSNILLEVLQPTDKTQGSQAIMLRLTRNGHESVATSGPITAAQMLSLQLDQAGEYTIGSEEGPIRQLKLRVIDETPHAPLITQTSYLPHLLKVELETATKIYAYTGTMDKKPVAHMVKLKHSGAGAEPVFHVSCPVPVKLTYSTGFEHGQTDVKDPAQLDEKVNALFMYAWKQKQSFSLLLDAGAFGCMHINIQEEISDAPAEQTQLFPTTQKVTITKQPQPAQTAKSPVPIPQPQAGQVVKQPGITSQQPQQGQTVKSPVSTQQSQSIPTVKSSIPAPQQQAGQTVKDIPSFLPPQPSRTANDLLAARKAQPTKIVAEVTSHAQPQSESIKPADQRILDDLLALFMKVHSQSVAEHTSLQHAITQSLQELEALKQSISLGAALPSAQMVERVAHLEEAILRGGQQIQQQIAALRGLCEYKNRTIGQSVQSMRQEVKAMKDREDVMYE